MFELSAYQRSDIDEFATTFFGSQFKPKLNDINVDDGSLTSQCPGDDTCQPASMAYFGDAEVDADIEMSLAVAPDEANEQVFNAPADETGQTTLDEYTAIADEDGASTISSN